MSEQVPEGWEIKCLSSACEKIWIGLVTTMTKFYVEKGVPLIRNSDIKESGINSSKLIHLDSEFAERNSSRVVLTNDVVTVHTGDVGTSAVIIEELSGAHGFATLNSRLDDRKVNPNYYCSILNSEYFKRQAKKIVTGDGRDNLNLKDFVKLLIPLPPLPEQKKIASILTSVDEVIEKTQSQIDKLQDLKKGTMNELLTKGIGHTEFKDSELGRIPKSWEVCALGEIGEFKNGVNKPKDAFGSGTKFVNISDAYPVDLDCRSLGRLEVTAQELVNYNLEVGDLVFVRSSVKLEGVAIPTIFKGFEEPVIFCGFMIRFRSRSTKVLPEFLREYLLTDEPRILIQRVATGGANININQEALSAFKVLLPTKDEQEYIVRKTNFANSQIAQLTLKCEKFQSLKKSLMQDLLTGKVRVSVN
jgi:type I restriction enzyme, S subunit